jgi:hypothetical protein
MVVQIIAAQCVEARQALGHKTVSANWWCSGHALAGIA